MSHLSSKENFISSYVLLPVMFQSEIRSCFIGQTGTFVHLSVCMISN